MAAEGIDRTVLGIQALVQADVKCLAQRRGTLMELLQIKLQQSCLRLQDMIMVRVVVVCRVC